MLKKLSLIALSAISALAMNSAEININDKDLEFRANIDVANLSYTAEPETTFVGFAYLDGSDENADSNVNISSYVEASFLLKREIQNSGIIFGLGVKSNYTKVRDETFISIPLGLEAGYILPLEIPAIFGVKVYYAPEVLSFSKAKRFVECRFDLSIEVIENGSVILGYRNINTDLEISNHTIDVNYNNSGYFGFRFAF